MKKVMLSLMMAMVVVGMSSCCNGNKEHKCGQCDTTEVSAVEHECEHKCKHEGECEHKCCKHHGEGHECEGKCKHEGEHKCKHEGEHKCQHDTAAHECQHQH